ncbi:MAG: 5'/3'-nucleotidase SurE [candidate division Zixibacteria bacterium]|nr:5'/3'-nucleotidase SurE [candidate division Zixibacteria bacterium]
MSKKRRRILITNDDGYNSDGITALFKTLDKVSDVFMVAPDREQSASSHSLTLNHPLRVFSLGKKQYTTDGTPTDCVMLALHLLFKKKRPDMIISGINHGPNMGDDVTYSGTVAAAIEGSIIGIPSIAVSVVGWEPGMSMKRAATFVVKLINLYDRLKLDPATFLNVNLPPDNGRPYRKFEFTRQGIRYYKDIIIRKTDPRGNPYYWIGGQPKWKNMKGTDYETVRRGVVSISPLKLNFTNTESLERLKKANFNP